MSVRSSRLGSEPLSLQRITTRHDPIEDRLRLSGETASGDALVIWMTQRLLHRLLPSLLQWLAASTDADSVVSDSLQQFAQEAAKRTHFAASDVTAPHQTPLLISRIDLRQHKRRITLCFKADHLALATLSMNNQQLYEWLHILHRQCEAADWPMTLWPQWLIRTYAPPRYAIIH